jgi:hypothetical protein
VTELLLGNAAFTEIEHQSSELDWRCVIMCEWLAVVEGRGTEKRDKDVCSEVDIVIYHQDWVSGGMGARE